MNKNYILCGLLSCAALIYPISLGPNLLANSPSAYLIDIEIFINDLTVTQQVGNTLYERDYINTVTTYDPQSGTAAQRPEEPGSGYTLNEGVWVWIPDSLGDTEGTWYWVLKTKAYFLSYIESIYEGF